MTMTNARFTRLDCARESAGRLRPRRTVALWALRLAQLRAWVRLEVHVLQPVGRQVRVELCGGDVGVTEHLLQAAQVAAAREEVRGERVPQRVRAHALGEAGRRRVALDDL